MNGFRREQQYLQIISISGYAKKSLKAKIELQINNYESAELSLNKALKLKPIASLKIDLAYCLQVKGREKSALKMYDKLAKK